MNDETQTAHPALRPVTEHRTQTTLMWLLLAFLIGTGVIIGVVLSLPIFGMGDRALNFFGSALGALVAAGTAITAIEWDRRRKQTEVQEIVRELLDGAVTGFESWAMWIDGGCPKDLQALAVRSANMLGEQMAEAMAIAGEIRGSVPRMARVRLALHYEARNIGRLRDLAPDLAGTSVPEMKEVAGKAVTAAIVCRNYLRK